MGFVAAREARVFTAHGASFCSYAGRHTDAADLRAWRLEVPAGTHGAAHRPSLEEVLLVLTGRLLVTIDAAERWLAAGDVAVVPAGALLRVDTGDEGGTAWVTTRRGLSAALADGSVMSPPWAQ